MATNLIGISGKIGAGKDTVGKIIQMLTLKDRGIDRLIKTSQLSPQFFDNLGTSDILKGSSDWEIKKFAYKLKLVASILIGAPIELFEDREFKEHLLGKEWNTMLKDDTKGEVFGTPNVRWLLQRIGTEAIREQIHYNAWVNALFADYHREGGSEGGERTASDGGYYSAPSIKGEYPKWVITDVRFPNEAEAIKNRGGILIRVERPKITEPTGYILMDRSNGEADKVVKYEQHFSEIALDDYNFDYTINNTGSIEQLIDVVKEILINENVIQN